MSQGTLELDGVRASSPLIDGCGRAITYLRVSLTPSCNLRCVYCVPSQGPGWKPSPAMTDEHVLRVIRVMAGMGVRKIRLTGGEPLLRKGLPQLVARIRGLAGIQEIALSTNGILLADQAAALKRAGLDRVNVSCDSLDPERFASITGGGRLEDVMKGLSAAWKAGLTPIKINCVLLKRVNESDVVRLAAMTVKKPFHVRFIELMPLGAAGPLHASRYLSASQARAWCEALGDLQPVKPAGEAGPAQVFRLKRARGTVGFISPISNMFCASCNRLRLTSDGWLRPCLDHRGGVDVKPALAADDPDAALATLVREAVSRKPAAHHMKDRLQEGDATPVMETMCAIGG